MTSDTLPHWRACPALVLAGCVALGIGLAARQAAPTLGAWVALGLGAPAAAGAAAYALRRRLVSPARLWWTLAAGTAALAAGAARYADTALLPPDHVARLARDDGVAVVVEGRVSAEPQARPYGLRFRLDVRRAAAGTDALGADTLDASGALLVTLRDDGEGPAVRLAYGAEVVLRGTLRPVPQRRNPADFDYGRYLRRQGVHATLYVAHPADVAVRGGPCRGAGCTVAAARAAVRDRYARLVPDDEARAILTGLVLGDRTGIDEETLDQFARTGLMHLLAVSGLHVFLVGMVLYGLLRPVLLRLGCSWRAMETMRTGVTLAVLVAYMVITGSSAPVVRAVVMATLLMGGVLLQRSAHTLNTLGVAAVVLLLARPAHLFEAGFQLSFAAVGAMVVLVPVFTRWVPESWQARAAVRYVAGLVTVSLAATLGTMPVLLYHFGAVSLAGLVLNVPAIPLTFMVLAAGLAALAAGGVSAFAGEVFGAAADVLARALLHVAGTGDAVLGWAAVSTRVDDPWILLAVVSAVLLPAVWPRPRARWRLVAAVLFFAAGGVWSGVVAGRHRPVLDVLFFDVGQGDAALVTFPGGRRLLVDAGMRDEATDQGARTILPHLERYGIDRLDAVVVTHPHSDHMGGLPAVLRAVPVGRVLHNGAGYASALYRETFALLDSLGVPHRAVRAGDTLCLDPATRVYVLAPPPGGAAGDDPNDASVVLRLAYGRTAFLFTGDVETAAEAVLSVRFGRLLPSDVVKVAHHGSSTSSTEPFVAGVTAAAQPLAVVSVARRNRFGHPSPAVLDRWRAHGAALYLTADAGALWLRSDGTRIRRVPWR